jgi:hypothetical protein
MTTREPTTARSLTRSMLRGATLLVLCAAACAGCVNSFGDRETPTQGDNIAEVQLFGEGMFNDWTPEGEWLVSPRLDAPDGVTRVGVLVELVEPGELPAMEARSLDGDLAGRWATVSSSWGEEDTHVGVADLGVGDGAMLRILATDTARIRTLRWNAVIPEVHDDASGEDLGATRAALRTELTGIGITSRESWGARATRCTARDSSRVRFSVVQ